MTKENPVVVITGASRGLGHGVAAAMAKRGARLGLCARTKPELDGAHCASVDVRDASAVQRFADEVVERLGPVSLWINNAGVLEPVAFVRDLTADALREHLDVNLMGVLHGTQAYVRLLRESGRGGVLINVSSGAARSGLAGWGAYCSGKAAVDRLTECVQLEEEALGLRAHAVAPGVIDTAMQALIRSKTPEEFPAVERFHDMKRDGAFSSVDYVADRLWALAFDPAARPDEVVVRLPPDA
jgi:benzil reductase ((S)-benzoin forming)